ncbi:hypothetical protein COL5a_001829 [Colletotrichum fioriniae]|uniref:Glycoside hydrolase family 39 n=1 Tax=Colletotrichum fioriniae PJ7 TaxID=1445577 RepID=A0A010QBN9_9PEZI|nr:uncharacterized protein COL516b_001218 [Colletotrichum fioriniae]EXF74195.1 hypothetical protein CFIO01_06789 [Colletotrichum fioriniae PJ7]KAJ0312148.1 hypothetical protein COL516b_001218 [Colletotrichum fioriniae]KAJ0332127.1 hypothetical protein COL5a_001829 [Colletotrichum fioriniae]KAJ3945873.1 hypothetical protein N0V96_004219 [Colletotrichum fioriniae]
MARNALVLLSGLLLPVLGAVLSAPEPVSNSVVQKRDLSGSSYVWLNDNTGTPQHMASGVLLGIPSNPDQIPDHWLSDIKFWNMRSGGSQLAEPRRGWTRGLNEFMGRYEYLKSAYQVTRRHGGNFQIMIHDMWGTDSYSSFAETPMPGDGGSYEDFDNFLDTFFALLKQDGMVDNIWWDLWNEIDNVDFLDRGIDRWLEYWGHAYHKIMRDFPNAKVIGPSYGHLPNFSQGVEQYFSRWAEFIKSNNSIPDQISLHFLYGNGDLTTSLDSYRQYLNAAGVDFQGIWNVQEYGHPDQQVPSGLIWNIGQLERHNVPGLRANWLGGQELNDYLAYLLGKDKTGANYDMYDTSYRPAREYPVYVYYAQSMTGYRVRTEMSEDTLVDTYATVDPSQRVVRILAGCRPNTGVWFVKIGGLSALGLPESGSLPIKAIRFNTAPGRFDRVAEPDDLGYTNYNYGDGIVTVAVYQNDPDVGFAFEFSY